MSNLRAGDAAVRGRTEVAFVHTSASEPWMSESQMPCLRQQELMEEVRRRLARLAELAHAEAEALKSRHHNLWKEIDQQIELTIGEKERCIGALNEHRKEHGC